MAPILQLLTILAGNSLLILLTWINHRELKKARRRAFLEGCDSIRLQAYPYVANCSISAHKKALAILRPDKL